MKRITARARAAVAAYQARVAAQPPELQYTPRYLLRGLAALAGLAAALVASTRWRT